MMDSVTAAGKANTEIKFRPASNFHTPAAAKPEAIAAIHEVVTEEAPEPVRLEIFEAPEEPGQTIKTIEGLMDKWGANCVNCKLTRKGSTPPRLVVKPGYEELEEGHHTVTVQYLKSSEEDPGVKVIHVFSNRLEATTPSRMNEKLEEFARVFKRHNAYLENLLERPVRASGSIIGVGWDTRDGNPDTSIEGDLRYVCRALINVPLSRIGDLIIRRGSNEVAAPFDIESENFSGERYRREGHIGHEIEHGRIGKPTEEAIRILLEEKTIFTGKLRRAIGYNSIDTEGICKLIKDSDLSPETQKQLTKKFHNEETSDNEEFLKRIAQMEFIRGNVKRGNWEDREPFAFELHELLLHIDELGRWTPLEALDAIFLKSGAVKRILDLLVPRVAA